MRQNKRQQGLEEMAMKQFKLKKLIAALQAGAMTTLVCISLPAYASDTELYKAPRSSETTIMFMVDLSGSMLYCDKADGTVNTTENCSPNRITKLKEGMVTLLQGDTSGGIEPLPDKLVVGLSEFSSPDRNGPFGRIKLEARPLGDTVAIGTKQIYKVVTPTAYTGNRTQTQELLRQNVQTRTKTKNIFFGAWSDWSDWSIGGWSNWSGGGVSDGSPSVTKVRGTPVVQECVEWENPISATNCSTWVNSSKLVSELSGYSSTESENYSFSSWNPSSGGWTEVVDSLSTSQTSNLDECSAKSGVIISYCSEQKETRTKIEHKNQTRSQTAVTTGQLEQIYTGTAFETHRKKILRAVNGLQAVGGTPTAYAYAEVAAYLMGQTTAGVSGAGSISGFTANVSNISNALSYANPTSVSSTKQCNTQGIYFLTDGAPTYYDSSSDNASNQYKRDTLQDFMKKSLGNKASSFSCDNASTLGKFSSGYSSTSKMTPSNSWDCIGAYSKTLLDPSLNPANVSIKTAVVGFGNDFSKKATSDEKDADKWGVLGGGGSYVGSDDKAVVNSVMSFLKKLQKYIPPVTTGSATIPLDNLDPQNIQPWAYFPQFDPAPDSQVTTWVGNLKKYASRSNQLFDRDSKAIMNATTGVSVDDPNDYWADTSVTKKIIKVVTENGKEVDKEIEVRVGGALSQLRLAKTTNERILYTDRKMALAAGTSSTYVAHPLLDGELIKFGTNDLKTNNASNNLDKDPKRGYLAALLGYNVTNDMAGGLTQESNSTFNNYLVPANATLRQMGAVMHSKPIMLTQEGTTQFNKETGQLEYVNRDDLIVFGTTQGVLHVVKAGKSATDADAGKEVFAFVPSEMVDSQPQAFLDQQYQGRTLQYGIDGQWTTHTEYVSKYINKDDKTPTVTVKGGKQTLYGGLRMGGKSYYALDLSTVTSDPITSGKPKIKFKISPSGTCAANSPLGCMGQSWSKPSIGWVNWKGQRKLVMFVGGGYDERYESTSDYSSSGTDKGAGVYMFDAENGALLWWASSNVATDTNSNEETYVSNMTKSVVSQIKTIDRNSDGLIDHLYFGDLGGQLWRVDINSALKAGLNTTGTGDDQVIGQTFAKHVTRILNMSGATAPRFYTTPTFTVHNGTGGLFGVVSIGSGNASFPMSSAANTNEGLYVIYDKDVAKRNLLVMASDALTTVDVSTSGEGSKKLVQNADGNTATEYANGGWYYPFTSKKKVLNDTAAVDSDLYVSVFDANVDIADVDCFGGVRGQSKVSQFCLPYGECRILSGTVYITQERPNDIFLGKGNIGISFGGQGKDRGLVLNLPSSGPFKTYNGRTQFISQRWYER